MVRSVTLYEVLPDCIHLYPFVYVCIFIIIKRLRE
jgi:hypothetical protein